MFLCCEMYLKLVLLGLVLTAGAIDDGSLDGLLQDESTEPEIETSTLPAVTEVEDEPEVKAKNRYFYYQPQGVQYPPDNTQQIPPTNFQDQYDIRYPDGSYEYRYELPNLTVRYERGFFINIQHKRILVVRGYYSYPLADGRFLTVYFTADHNGYRQDSSIISGQRPPLYKHLSAEVDHTEKFTPDWTESPEIHQG